jgi:hypothetical protein
MWIERDMMNWFLLAPFLFIGLIGCAHEAPMPSTGYLPADAFGDSVIGEDPAIAATNAATEAFANPRMMQGRPARMALAIASLDAMAGQFSTRGRWMAMDPIAKQEMLDARNQVRDILGVPETTQSQSLIDHLVAASHALDQGDQVAALTALSGPDFTKPPVQTLALLTNFPKVPNANYATMAASQNLFPMDGGFGKMN